MIGIGGLILAQLAVTVTAPDTMRVNTTAEVHVRVVAPAGRTASLTPPSLRPFIVVRVQQSARTDPAMNGRFVADYQYTLAASREGTYQIGAFVARTGALSASSSPTRIVVLGARGADRAPAIIAKSAIDTSVPVTFRALATPDTVYVGQQATYELGVFLEESVRDRLRRMEAIAPEMRGLMAYDAPLPSTGFTPRVVAGRRYESHVYQRAIFPLAPGRYVLPPARLVYALPLNYSFFSREESFELRSDSVIVVALDPPTAARPPGYVGAVGDLRLAATLDTAAARVGDPLSLTVRVSGVGNVKLFPRPPVSIPWATVLAAGERVTLAGDSLRIRGAKDFTYVLTPLRSGPLTIPPLHYSYFDPGTARYETAESAAIPVIVAPGTLAAVDSTAPAGPERLSLRATYRGAWSPPIYTRREIWWALLAVPIPALALQLARRPRRRRQPRAARRLRALTRAHGADSARESRRAFVDALSQRLGIPAEALAEPAALERFARRSGTSDETAQRAAAVLATLDRAAFASVPELEAGAAHDAYRVYLDIDREARSAAHNASASAGLIMAALLAIASLLHATSLSPDALRFAHGVDAYGRGRFPVAAADFAAVTAARPAAPDAWANAGTTAWAAGDTARAVQGWERSLRLEPSAGDVRARLELVPAVADDALAAVPPVSPTPIAILAALLWCATWMYVAASRPRAADGAIRPRTLALMGCAGTALLIGVTAALESPLAAADLAVLGRHTSLLATPALGSERGQTISAGGVVRVLERRDAWARVAIDAERDGWVDASTLLPLARQ